MNLLNKILIGLAVSIWGTAIIWYFWPEPAPVPPPKLITEIKASKPNAKLFCVGFKGINQGKMAPADMLIMEVDETDFQHNRLNQCRRERMDMPLIKSFLWDQSQMLQQRGVNFAVALKLNDGSLLKVKAELSYKRKKSQKFNEKELDRLIQTCMIKHPSMVESYVQLKYGEQTECSRTTREDVFLGIKLENGHLDRLSCSNGTVFKTCRLITSLDQHELIIGNVPIGQVANIDEIKNHVRDYLRPKIKLDFVENKSCSGILCQSLAVNGVREEDRQ